MTARPAPRRTAESTAATWSLWVDETPRPGWQQMAIDEAMLNRASQGFATLRLYRWSPSCLSFGSNEPALAVYDRGRIASLGLDTVRRPTGGRAVWHADELTYSIASPVDCFGGLRSAYCEIHIFLASALGRLGVELTRAAPAPQAPLTSGACFSSSAGGELQHAGRKLLGSAQMRRGRSLLQHGSLLLSGRQDIITRISKNPDTANTTTLSSVAGTPIGFSEAAAAIVQEATSWLAVWHDLRSTDLLAAAEPLAQRYRSSEWTWRM